MGREAATASVAATPARAAVAAAPARPSLALPALHAAGIMPALRLGAVDDPAEREAERIADAVLADRPPPPATATPAIRRACARCDDEEDATIRRRAMPSPSPLPSPSSPASLPSAVTAATAGGGAPLPAAERAYFEPRLGLDLAGVRVHTGPAAARGAAAIDALAYTAGRDVVFGAGQWAPGSPAGRRLLAHELAHVAQAAPATVRRFPYETRGIALDRTQIATLAGQSYWEQRTLTTYAAAFDARMNADAEERDAVLSVLWGMNPPVTVRSRQVMVVPIASRTLPAPPPVQGQPAQPAPVAPALLYRFTFEPPAPGDVRPRLQFDFIASGATAAPVALPDAPGHTPATPGRTSWQGLPSGMDLAAWWAAHPDEHRAVFNWIENTAPASFDQVVTVATTTTGRRGATRVSHRAVLRLSGSHSGSTVASLTVRLISEGEVSPGQSAAAGYRDRDMGDLELERLQAGTVATANRLGAVTLPASIPADERLPVKYAIWQYFSGGARNTEVDAIVPVGTTGSRTVHYTLVFGAGNAVTATRVGEAGSGSGMVDVNRIDVARVRGFPTAQVAAAAAARAAANAPNAAAGAAATAAAAEATAASALRSFWSTRYPGGGSLTAAPVQQPGQPAQAGPTPTVLIADMNRLIAAGIANASWFIGNWGITVLAGSALDARMNSAHGAPTGTITDAIDFTAAELQALEVSLQTLGDAELAHLRGVNIGRKQTAINRSTTGQTTTWAAGPATQYGVTYMDQPSGGTMAITVLYFDSLAMNNDRIFRGNTAANALPDVAMNLLHELGHAIGHRSAGTQDIHAAFEAWRARPGNAQASPTWYAGSDPADELFPEAFALYHTDPHFLCGSAPRMYAWFDELARTGSPPAANATVTAPASCP